MKLDFKKFLIAIYTHNAIYTHKYIPNIMSSSQFAQLYLKLINLCKQLVLISKLDFHKYWLSALNNISIWDYYLSEISTFSLELIDMRIDMRIKPNFTIIRLFVLKFLNFRIRPESNSAILKTLRKQNFP